MYVSRAVRSIRADPIPGETVTLLATVAEDPPGSADAVEASVRAVADEHDGRVEPLAFETVAVTVPQEAVGALCAVEGLATVETDDTLSMTLGGAGEDVDYEE